MTGEKRTIEILAQVKDLATTGLQRIGNTISRVFGGAAATLRGFSSSLGPVQAGITGLVGALAIRSGVNAFQDLAEGLAAVSRSAQQVGATASSLYLLRNAAAANGVQFEQLSQSLVVFEKNIDAARQGGQEQQTTLRQLGLDSEQFVGSQRNVVEQLAVVADAFGKVQDEGQRTSLATKLFGDVGAKLLPLLRQGGTALREYAAAQKAAGLALSDKDLQSVLVYQRELAALQNTLRTLAEQVVVQFAPVLTKALQDIQAAVLDNAPQIRRAFADLFDVLVEGLDLLLSSASLITEAINGLRIVAEVAKAAYGYTQGIFANKEQVDNIKNINAQTTASIALFNRLSDSLRKVADSQRALRQPGGVVDLPTFNVIAPPEPAVQSSYDKFWDGFSAGARQAKQALLDWRATGMAAARTLIDSGINNVSNAITAAVTRTASWAEAFRQAGLSILSDLTRIIAKLLIVRFLESTLFSGGGGEAAPSGAGTGSGVGGGASFGGGGGLFEARLATDAPGVGSGSLGSTLERSGGTVNISYNISAMDGADVQRVLLRNRGTLRALHQQDVARNRGVRQGIRGAAR